MRGLQVSLESPPCPAHHGCQLWCNQALGGWGLRILPDSGPTHQTGKLCMPCLSAVAPAINILKQGLMLPEVLCQCLRGVCRGALTDLLTSVSCPILSHVPHAG